MKLNHLTDKSLLIDTKKSVADERRSTTAVLYHLQEIDRRRMFPSLYHYCVRELGYSGAAAQRRIVSARLLEKIPEMKQKIESGELTLTNIEQVTFFYKDTDSQKEALKEVEGLTRKEAEKKLFEITGKVIPAKESKEQLKDNKAKVAIILSDETVALMEKFKKLSGKSESDDIIQYAMEAVIEKLNTVKSIKKSQPLAKVKREEVIMNAEINFLTNGYSSQDSS